MIKTIKDQEKPLVSICTTTYNHVAYISETIEGFLMQKTDFPIEILINDDASTDGTDEIVKEYEIKYPVLIKPTYQKENQYSKGVAPMAQLVLPRAKGKYIALCEGDDYWTDPLKLQKQVDFMEKNPEVSMLFHAVYKDDGSGNKTIIGLRSSNERLFYIDDIIKGGGGFCPTPSLLLRKSIVDNLPSWFSSLKVGDYFLQMFASTYDPVFFMPEPMAAYRVGDKKSWTKKNKSNPKSTIKHYKTLIKDLHRFNNHFSYKHNYSIKKKIISCHIKIIKSYFLFFQAKMVKIFYI